MAKRQRLRRQRRRREHAKRDGWSTRHSVITGAGIAATATLGLAGAAQAAYYYVGSNADTATATDCDDAGNTDCTLRDAVTAANGNAGYDYILFTSNVSGTITIGSSIPISEGVYIYGRGPDTDAVSGDDASRIFDIDLNNPGETVRIYGLTLTHGYADHGGAIRNYNSSLRINTDDFVSNAADGHGGAIWEGGESGADLAVFYSTFSGNDAAQGGALYAGADLGAVRTSTFSGNGALDGSGGAIKGDSAYLADSTISGNSATVSGGGVSAGSLSIYGTILANNTADVSNSDLDAGGGYAAFDLVEDPGDSGIGTIASVITGQDPQLGGLQDNGGYTPTLKPAASSPVVDQSYSFSYYDQRGYARIVDNPNRANAATGPYAAADIGAVELTLAEGPQAAPNPPAPPAHMPHKKKKCKKKKKHRSAEAAKKKKCKKKKRRSAESHPGFRFRVPHASAGLWPGGAERHPFRLDR